MSRFVMRPLMPVPFPASAVRLTPCSFAILRTRGDDRTPSTSISPSPSSSKSGVGPAIGAGPSFVCASFLCSFGGFGGSLGGSFDGALGTGSWGVGCAGCAAPSPITATTVLICTVSPSFTRTSCKTPDAGAGISVSILSVEISNNGSSRSTRSPFFLSHFVIVPSKMLSPIWGMMTLVSAILSYLIGVQFSSHTDDVGRFRKKILLQWRAVRHGSVGSRNAADRAVKKFKCLFGNHSRQFAGESSNLSVLMQENDFVCLLNGFEHSL